MSFRESSLICPLSIVVTDLEQGRYRFQDNTLSHDFHTNQSIFCTLDFAHAIECSSLLNRRSQPWEISQYVLVLRFEEMNSNDFCFISLCSIRRCSSSIFCDILHYYWVIAFSLSFWPIFRWSSSKKHVDDEEHYHYKHHNTCNSKSVLLFWVHFVTK